MPHATRPKVFYDDNQGRYVAEMVDIKTNRVWGTGFGETRSEAIIRARQDQPSDGIIKAAIGWVRRHPFLAGAAVGVFLAHRYAAHHHVSLRPIDYLNIGTVTGTLVWAVSKMFQALRE